MLIWQEIFAPARLFHSAQIEDMIEALTDADYDAPAPRDTGAATAHHGTPPSGEAGT